MARYTTLLWTLHFFVSGAWTYGARQLQRDLVAAHLSPSPLRLASQPKRVSLLFETYDVTMLMLSNRLLLFCPAPGRISPFTLMEFSRGRRLAAATAAHARAGRKAPGSRVPRSPLHHTALRRLTKMDLLLESPTRIGLAVRQQLAPPSDGLNWVSFPCVRLGLAT